MASNDDEDASVAGEAADPPDAVDVVDTRNAADDADDGDACLANANPFLGLIHLDPKENGGPASAPTGCLRKVRPCDFCQDMKASS